MLFFCELFLVSKKETCKRNNEPVQKGIGEKQENWELSGYPLCGVVALFGFNYSYVKALVNIQIKELKKENKCPRLKFPY